MLKQPFDVSENNIPVYVSENGNFHEFCCVGFDGAVTKLVLISHGLKMFKKTER
jgi:hypothetical protein